MLDIVVAEDLAFAAGPGGRLRSSNCGFSASDRIRQFGISFCDGSRWPVWFEDIARGEEQAKPACRADRPVRPRAAPADDGCRRLLRGAARRRCRRGLGGLEPLAPTHLGVLGPCRDSRWSTRSPTLRGPLRRVPRSACGNRPAIRSRSAKKPDKRPLVIGRRLRGGTEEFAVIHHENLAGDLKKQTGRTGQPSSNWPDWPAFKKRHLFRAFPRFNVYWRNIPHFVGPCGHAA